MKPVLVLWYGILFDFLLGFIVSVFQSYINHDVTEIAWPFLIYGLSSFFFKYLIDKVDKAKGKFKEKEIETILSRIELVLLIGNILILVFTSGFVLATFSKYWFSSNDVRFTSIVIGLSNLIAIIYWSAIRIKKTT